MLRDIGEREYKRYFIHLKNKIDKNFYSVKLMQ